MVEQLICNHQVAGSSPVLGSSNLGLDSREGYPSGQRGQTVNLLAKPSKVRILLPPPCRGMEQLVARRAHNPKVAGSNPAPATIALKRPEGAEIRSAQGREMKNNPAGIITKIARRANQRFEVSPEGGLR